MREELRNNNNNNKKSVKHMLKRQNENATRRLPLLISKFEDPNDSVRECAALGQMNQTEPRINSNLFANSFD